MKKVTMTVIAAITITTAALSQKPGFAPAMGAALTEFGNAKTTTDFSAASSKFQRIADAEQTQWLPYYYAALSKLRISQIDQKADKDKLADEASALLDKAEAIEKNNSELYCLRAIVASTHMMVNPMERWQQYGQEFEMNLAVAKKADSTNPRPVVLKAISTAMTPEQFGGGCDVAKPTIQKANELLASFKPLSPLHPVWGKEIIDGLLERCK